MHPLHYRAWRGALLASAMHFRLQHNPAGVKREQRRLGDLRYAYHRHRERSQTPCHQPRA